MFLDTNILLASRFRDSQGSASARRLVMGATSSSERLHISRQILREYLAASTRPQPWGSARSMTEALTDIAWMQERFDILEDGPAVTTLLESLCRDVPVAGKQVHDANIVATMLAHGERRLATLNAKDFRRYGDRIEIVSG